jgi:peptide/nickel transport system permease protein
MGTGRLSATGWIGLAAVLVLGLVMLAAAAAPWLVAGDPDAMVAPPLVAPFADAAHPLGTDSLGRDLLAGVIYGARVSVVIGLAAAAAALGLGMAVGTLAGFIGGWTDAALMRITDGFQTIPTFLLALALVSMLGPTNGAVVLAIAIGSWPGPARLVRAEILSLRSRDFVAGCRAIGMRPLRIAFTQVLPNALAAVVSLAGVLVAAAILIESALSFLGLGDPNLVSWGGMVAKGSSQLRTAPYLVAIPGIAIAATVLAVTLASDWLVEHLTSAKAPA